MSAANGTDGGLADGWDPGTDGDMLLRSMFEAWVSDVAHNTSEMGGRIEDRGDVVLADVGFASPFTAMAFLRGPVSIDRVADVLPWFTGTHGVFSPVPTPDLSPLGLIPVGHPPFMFRPAGGVAPAIPSGVELVECTDAETMGEFERCLVEGYPLPGGEAWTPGAVFDERVLSPTSRFWIARAGASTVACAGVHVHVGVNCVGYVATRADARGRGIGEGVTWAATLADPSLPAVLLASDPGRSIYARMGYLPVSRFTLWMRP